MTPSRSERFMTLLRVLLSLLIAAHGWSRLLNDAVAPFGTWLDGQGIPLGLTIAWSITLLEILGTPLLAWGRFITALCLVYATIYLVGILLVHAPAGWFVVGLGRNGMEYSVLLIACLLGIAWTHFPGRSKTLEIS